MRGRVTACYLSWNHSHQGHFCDTVVRYIGLPHIPPFEASNPRSQVNQAESSMRHWISILLAVPQAPV